MLTSDPWTDRTAALPDVSTLTRRASKQAYEKAGVGPKDIALTELHDCFATAELVHYENLGLCGDGEAGAFIDSGGGKHPGLGGHDPVNVSGGLLSKGHPLGATGVANICEVVWHLTAGRSRQGSPGAQRQGRTGPRYRARLGLHDSCPDDLMSSLIRSSGRPPLKRPLPFADSIKGRPRGGPFSRPPARIDLWIRW